jgi:hypothetical protein
MTGALGLEAFQAQIPQTTLSPGETLFLNGMGDTVGPEEPMQMQSHFNNAASNASIVWSWGGIEVSHASTAFTNNAWLSTWLST